MEENNSNELNKAHEKDIENGGQGLNNEHGEVDAVKNKEKTADQIERMMSQDEIFTVVRENGIYSNMLAPCLSANIFLDGRIMSYFTTPMKPIDLDDKVNDVMQLVLMEISKEQNGVVFKPDGSIDVGESIKQAALNGMQPIPLLRDTMPAGMADALAQKYYDMNKTGMDASFAISQNKENLVEEIFSNKEKKKEFVKIHYRMDEDELKGMLASSLGSVDKAKEDYEKHEKYHNVFDADEYSDDMKEELTELINENKQRIAEIEEKLKEIAVKLQTYERGSPEFEAAMEEMKPYTSERSKLQMEIDAIGNIENDTYEEVQAKGLMATTSILRKLGIKDGIAKDVRDDLTALNQTYKRCKVATKTEIYTNTVEKNYLTDMAKTDANRLKEFRELNMQGVLGEDERNAYMLTSLRNYITYMNLKNDKAAEVVSQDLVDLNINQAFNGLVATIPNVKDEKGNLDWNRILDAVKVLPGYENINIDNIKNVFLEEKATVIVEDIKELVESSRLDIEEHKEADEVSFVDGFKEEDKEIELCKYVNYVRHLESKGITNAATRMFRYKLEKEGMHHILDKADELYEDSVPYIEETMDNYKRGLAFAKYKELKRYTTSEISKLTNEEKGSIVSAMIAAYDISRDESEISVEIQKAAKDTFKTLLGDVFDEHGDIDDEKLFAQYKKANPQGKYGLGKETEDIDAFWEFHEAMSLTKVQKKVTSRFMDVANDRNQEVLHDAFITEEEAKKKVDERGETLEDSAITDPKKTVEPKAPAEITKKEAEEAMDKKGEPMRVDDPKVVEADKKVVTTPPIDKKKEEEGNTLNPEDTQNKNNSLVVKDEGKNIFAKAWKFIKEKVSNIFGGSSSSDTNNNATTGGGNVVENKQVQQIAAKNDNWVAPAIVNVKQAQADAKAAKAEKEAKEAEEAEKPMNDDGPTL